MGLYIIYIAILCIPESSNERFFLSVSNFSGLWTEFLKMDGIYENIRNF